MVKGMTAILSKNPVVNLLDLLPKQIAEVKRKAIEADLLDAGQYQHYRQSVRRDSWKMSDTRVQCATILMNHLGLSLAFFTGTEQEQEAEVDALVKACYQSVTQ